MNTIIPQKRIPTKWDICNQCNSKVKHSALPSEDVYSACLDLLCHECRNKMMDLFLDLCDEVNK